MGNPSSRSQGTSLMLVLLRTELHAPIVQGDTILGLVHGDTAKVAAAVACAAACGFGSVGFGY